MPSHTGGPVRLQLHSYLCTIFTDPSSYLSCRLFSCHPSSSSCLSSYLLPCHLFSYRLSSSSCLSSYLWPCRLFSYHLSSCRPASWCPVEPGREKKARQIPGLRDL